MLENELALFQQEIGQIKHDLMSGKVQPSLDDGESYKLATKIDLTVSRLLRLLECKPRE
ncbi:MAG: hypothetical protein GX075_03620 [Firmicutes bacterium]|nr:hypothetical protein [Bacillota bacterium]